MKRKNQKTRYRLKTNLPINGAGECFTPDEWFAKYGYININGNNSFFEQESDKGDNNENKL